MTDGNEFVSLVVPCKMSRDHHASTWLRNHVSGLSVENLVMLNSMTQFHSSPQWLCNCSNQTISVFYIQLWLGFLCKTIYMRFPTHFPQNLKLEYEDKTLHKEFSVFGTGLEAY